MSNTSINNNFKKANWMDIFSNWLFLIPALLVIACFANTLGNGFVYDDRFVIANNKHIQDFSINNILAAFKTDFWSFLAEGLQGSSSYYRPVHSIALMINQIFAGNDPFKWHLSAVLMHALVSAMAFKLVHNSLLPIDNISNKERQWMSLIAACCFAIHPAQVESVAFVTAYISSISTVFIFGAMLIYLYLAKLGQFNQQLKWLIPSLILYFIALLSKEVAIVLPAIIVIYEVFILRTNLAWKDRIKAALLPLLSFTIVTVSYLLLRIYIIGVILHSQGSNGNYPDLPKPTLLTTIYTFPSMLWEYFKIICCPFSLSIIYSIRPVYTPIWSKFALEIIVLIAIAIAMIIIVYKSKIARLGLIWLIFPLMPVLDVRLFNYELIVQDRYLYLSLLGVGILLAGIARWLNYRLAKLSDNDQPDEIRGSISLVMVVLLLIMFAGSIKQNRVWANEETLWGNAHEIDPNSCLACVELGHINEEAEHYEEAMVYYRKATTICPNSLKNNLNMGYLSLKMNDYQSAAQAFEHVVTINNNVIIQATCYFNLGLIYEKLGQYELAISNYQKGLALQPQSKNAQEVQAVIKELSTKIAQSKLHN